MCIAPVFREEIERKGKESIAYLKRLRNREDNMLKFRKKPGVVEAWQWHGVPDEYVWKYQDKNRDDPKRECQHCGNEMRAHGWIDTLEGGHIICPEDWIIIGAKGELDSCKPDIFELTYESTEQMSMSYESPPIILNRLKLSAGFIVHVNGIPVELESDTFVLGNKENFTVDNDS